MFILLHPGVFGIFNTEMGSGASSLHHCRKPSVLAAGCGLDGQPLCADHCLSAPVVPLLFSRVNRKTVMVLALSVFVISNLVSVFTTNFTVLLITRAIPAFFHPLYVSIAFSTAASSVSREDAPKAVLQNLCRSIGRNGVGVPVTSYIASEFSFSAAMVFLPLLILHLYCFATIFPILSRPVKERLSHGT